MPEYNIYPAVDANYNFPPQIKQTIVSYPEILDTQGRVDEAERKLVENEKQVAAAKAQLLASTEDLRVLEEVTLPAAVEKLEQADATAAVELGTLDGNLETAKQEIAAAETSINDLKTVTLPTMRQELEDAQAQAQADLDALNTRLTDIDAVGTGKLASIRDALAAAEQVANNANDAAIAADQAASAASQAALEAAGIAASKGRVIIQVTEPTGDDRQAANIWIKPAVDDPDTDITETATTYVYIADTDTWMPTTSDELAQAAQNALDAREAADQAKQRAETAISNAATAQAAAEAAQRTANQATLDARGAHNEAVEAKRRLEEARGSLVNLTPWGGMENPLVGGDPQGPAGWNQHYDPEGAPPGFNAYVETVVDDGQSANVGMGDLGDSPVRPGHTYRLTSWIWTNAVSDNLMIGYFPVWRMPDGSRFNGVWGAGYRPFGRSGNHGNVAADPFVSGQWRKVVEDFVPPTVGGVTAIGWIPRMHRWQAGYVGYGADGTSEIGDIWRFTGIRLEDVTDLLSAEAAAKAAQDRADEAYVEAERKLDESQVQAIADLSQAAAEASSLAEIEAAEARAAAEALRVAKAEAAREAGEAETAAKAYADLIDTGASDSDLAAARTYAEEQAEEARVAAEKAAALDATAKTEAAEARAAADAKTKADAALAAAKAELADARSEITSEILTSANGKNSITVSLNGPSGSGVVDGDIWWQRDTSSDIFGQWTWSKSNQLWIPRLVRSEVIANLDVHKLKVTGDTEIKSAVIEKLWADGIAAKSINASRLAVSPGNLFPDPFFSEPEKWNNTNQEVIVDTEVPNNTAFELTQKSSLTGSYYGGLGHKAFSMEGGAKYRLRVMAKFADDTIPYLLVYFRMPRRNQGDASYSVRLYRTAEATGQYAYLETECHANSDIEGRGTVGFFLNGGSGSSSVRVAAPELVRKVGAVLIEDGAVSAKKIQAESVAGAVGEFVEAEVGNLKATKGTVGEAVIDKLWVDGLVGKTATFNQLTIAGQGIAPPMTDESLWQLRDAQWVTNSFSRTGYAIKITPDTGGDAYGPVIPVTPGDSYRVTAHLGRIGSSRDTGGRYYIGVRGTDEDGNVTEYGPYAVVGDTNANWDTEVSGEITIREGTHYARAYILLQEATGTPHSSGHTTVYNFRIQPMASAVLIEDGAVTTPKLTVTETMAAKIAQFMSVSTKELIVSDGATVNNAKLIGDTWVENLTTSKIIGNNGIFTGTVDANHINGGSFTGKTFSGGTFTGARLNAVDSAGYGLAIIPKTSGDDAAIFFTDDGSLTAGQAAVWRNGYTKGAPAELMLRGAHGADVRIQDDLYVNQRCKVNRLECRSDFQNDGNANIKRNLTVGGGRDGSAGSIFAPIVDAAQYYVRDRIDIQGSGVFVNYGALRQHGSTVYFHNLPSSSSTGNMVINNTNRRAYQNFSTRRVKSNIEDWTPSAEQVLALQPRQWVHNDPNNDPEDNGAHSVGFIAEEVEEAGLESLVVYGTDGLPQSLSYDRFPAAQQVVLQKHEAEIQELRAENDELKNRLDGLEATVAQLVAQNNQNGSN